MIAADIHALTDPLHDEAVRLLCDLVRIPSVASNHAALRRAADHVADLSRECGLDTEVWEGPDHPPVVFGSRPAPPGRPTVLWYGHYDVQPTGPEHLWTTPPFEPDVRESAVFGRGAGDNKGQFLGHLMALRALHVADRLGIGVRLLIEGEEEVGSPHLAGVVAEHRDELRSDLAITADGPFHEDGHPLLIFGVRGILVLELEARGANRDLHSGNRGGLVPAPTARLARALGSLVDTDGRVRVSGFYDDVVPPTDREEELLETLPFAARSLLDDLGLDRLPAAAADSPWSALMFRPNLNICGLEAGYTGPEVKTVIGHRAFARIDVRLVADQDPDRVTSAIRDHIERCEPGIEVRKRVAVPPSATPIDTPYADTVAASLEMAAGIKPYLRPRLGGTTPDHVFTRILGVPSLLTPYGPPDMNHHAPDERMTLDALQRGIRTTAAICCRMGDVQ